MTEETVTEQDTLVSIRDARGLFEDARRRAAAAEYTPKLDVDAVLAEFDALEAAVTDASEEELQTLAANAERLGRLRAYVYPNAELQIEGKTAFADLSQWGVPPAVLNTIQSDLLVTLGTPLDAPDTGRARAALRALYEAYDSWAYYVDEYAEYMQRLAGWLLGLEAVALVVTLNRFLYGDVILGFLGAGVCGALVSVISKMPPLVADAEWDAYFRRILMRVGTGVAAVLIGGGFLASGIVTVTLPNSRVTVSDLVELCGKETCRSEACRLNAAETGWWQWIAAKLKRQPLPVEEARVAGTPPAARCTTGGVLLLLGLGLLLGFSERALTSLEDKVFPASARSA